MSTGLFDWLGAEQNLTVLAGRAWERELEFIDTTDGGREAMDVSDVTFDGVVTGADGSEVGIEVSHREGEGSLLLVVFPALEAGVYRWELRAVDDSGEKRRMMYGRLGVLATSLDLEREADDGVEALRMRALVPGRDARRIMAEWRATTRALLAAGEATAAARLITEDAAEAKRYAEEAAASAAAARQSAEGVMDHAREVAEAATRELRGELERLKDDTEGTRRSAEATVQRLEVFMARFEDNVRSVVVVDPESGHLFIGGVDTLAKVTGDPGKSPYVDGNGDWQYWDDESEQWKNGGPARGEDGFAPYLDAGGYLVYRDALTGEVVRSAQPLKGKDGINGGNVRRILVRSVSDLPRSGETCNGGVYYYVPTGSGGEDGYDVYAWVERTDGGAEGWVRVGLANDIATREIYGLTKLGTDVVVQGGGAPVGVNAGGEMNVPHADYGTPGAMLPSATETLGSSDGVVGFDGSGRARVPSASFDKKGVVQLSFRGAAAVPIIGAMADGKLGTTWATLNQAGVVLLGSQYGQGNPIPYKVGIGADEGHHLANNLIFGGAYKHMSPVSWRGLALPWLDALMDEHPEWFTDAYYSGLHTSLQFTQSKEGGLELLSATGSVKAGVYLALSMEDERPEAALTPRTVRDWVHAECYTRSEADEKIRVEVGKVNDALSLRIEANKNKFNEYTNTEGMKSYVASALVPYEKTSKLLGRDYATNGRVTQLDAQNIKCTDGIQRIYVLAPEAFEASRGKRDAKGLYIKATM